MWWVHLLIRNNIPGCRYFELQCELLERLLRALGGSVPYIQRVQPLLLRYNLYGDWIETCLYSRWTHVALDKPSRMNLRSMEWKYYPYSANRKRNGPFMVFLPFMREGYPQRIFLGYGSYGVSVDPEDVVGDVRYFIAPPRQPAPQPTDAV